MAPQLCRILDEIASSRSSTTLKKALAYKAVEMAMQAPHESVEIDHVHVPAHGGDNDEILNAIRAGAAECLARLNCNHAVSGRAQTSLSTCIRVKEIRQAHTAEDLLGLKWLADAADAIRHLTVPFVHKLVASVPLGVGRHVEVPEVQSFDVPMPNAAVEVGRNPVADLRTCAFLWWSMCGKKLGPHPSAAVLAEFAEWCKSEQCMGEL